MSEKAINEQEQLFKIEKLLMKIDSGQGAPSEITESITEMVKLQTEIQDNKSEFRRRVIELVPDDSRHEIYKITQSLPIEHQEEYILLLSDGLSYDAAYDKLKIKYNF